MCKYEHPHYHPSNLRSCVGTCSKADSHLVDSSPNNGIYSTLFDFKIAAPFISSRIHDHDVG